MRHRIIRYVDALFIGIVLGLLFVALTHASATIDSAVSAHILPR